MTADQDNIVHLGKALCISLSEDLATRAEIYGMNGAACFVTGVTPGIIKGICLHNGTLTATVGVVVYLVLLVGGIVSNLMSLNTDDPALLSPT